MKIGLNHAAIELARRQDLQVVDGAGFTVTCHRGSLWITQHHDTRDIILGPGESFVLDRRGLALIRANEASSLSVDEPAPTGASEALLRFRRAITAGFDPAAGAGAA